MTSEVAREVAAREGMKAYLTGEIIPAGQGFVIAVRLVSPSSGDALVSLRRNVASPDDLMDGLLPRGRIIKDDTLSELVVHPPKSQDDLGRIRGLSAGWRSNDIGARLIEAKPGSRPG